MMMDEEAVGYPSALMFPLDSHTITKHGHLVNIGHTTMSLLLTGKQIFLFIEDLHQLGKLGFQTKVIRAKIPFGWMQYVDRSLQVGVSNE